MVLLIHKKMLEARRVKWTLEELRTPMSGSYLDNRLTPNNLKDLAAPLCAIGQGQMDNLSIPGELKNDIIN